MSLEARQSLVNSGRLIFQRDSQRTDLLDPKLTQTELIAFLIEICQKEKFTLEVTAVRSDHGDDSSLGPHGHAHGFAIDCWPLNSSTPGDYMDPGEPQFQDMLTNATQAPFYYQTGLAGSAYTPENMKAAGPAAFHDDGADHVHFGTR